MTGLPPLISLLAGCNVAPAPVVAPGADFLAALEAAAGISADTVAVTAAPAGTDSASAVDDPSIPTPGQSPTEGPKRPAAGPFSSPKNRKPALPEAIVPIVVMPPVLAQVVRTGLAPALSSPVMTPDESAGTAIETPQPAAPPAANLEAVMASPAKPPIAPVKIDVGTSPVVAGTAAGAPDPVATPTPQPVAPAEIDIAAAPSNSEGRATAPEKPPVVSAPGVRAHSKSEQEPETVESMERPEVETRPAQLKLETPRPAATPREEPVSTPPVVPATEKAEAEARPEVDPKPQARQTIPAVGGGAPKIAKARVDPAPPEEAPVEVAADAPLARAVAAAYQPATVTAPVVVPADEAAPAVPSAVAALPKSAPAKAPLAFGARLRPADPDPPAAPPEPAGKAQAKPERRQDPPETIESVKTRAAKPDERTGAAPAESRDVMPDDPAPPVATVRGAAPERSPSTDSAEPKAVAKPPAAPEPPKAAPVARDIHIEVGGAEKKVEVRLVERAGEVQLAVRTPDERLAGALREELPALSSRLEQSGFRADQWRAAETGGAERRLDVGAAAESSGRAPEHGGRQRRDDEPQRPEPPGERKKSEEKGTAFEWLMQSLR